MLLGDADRCRENQGFIFYNQHSFRASWLGAGLIGRLTNADLISYHRQINVKAGPLSQFALHLDMAIALLNDSVAERQSQTSALTHLFGGKKRLEHGVYSFTAYTSAGVVYRQGGILSRWQFLGAVFRLRVENYRTGFGW